ncbi:E3 ubiquitin-protein ligase DCST1 isoform X2 [Betta splendens]|uniref:E3 ubiquitin-protein ligase DCST1 isoform X2 n=1 Tax=Betta splendens TaxID=158456 RepID=A0A8M1H1Y8_BETSP|nr:E3 ubiquitin-protein ligase DCST1 isoform X2 [Betta splendens]
MGQIGPRRRSEPQTEPSDSEWLRGSKQLDANALQRFGTSLRSLVLRAAFGAFSGTALYLGIIHNLPPSLSLTSAAGVVFVAVCAVAGAWSSSFRCSLLLMFPSMLGSRGHAYLMVFTLSVLYKGPISNMHQNIEEAALSLSCNLDLQVNNSKLLWRDAVRPFIAITQELMDSKAEFESEILNISRRFQSIRDEMVFQYGHSHFKNQSSADSGNSTQQQFTAKSRMQCNDVVEDGVQRCADWFALRWKECMEVVPVPVISHMVCVSMKFHFLCDIIRVMTPWCTQQIPVEGNFGKLFDQLDGSVEQLSRQFSAELVLQEQQQQAVLAGAGMDQQFTQAVKESFRNLTTPVEQLLNVLQLLMSCTFISIFMQGFSYHRCYRRDIQFDNFYITAYFRQIDARRRNAGKCFLLPLKRSERKKFVDPSSLRIHPEELRQVVSGGVQVLSVALLCVVLLTVDFSLFHVLDIVSRHTFSQFNLTSKCTSEAAALNMASIGGHQVSVRVGGASMMARLLRRTVSAFNSSSGLHIYTDNQGCASPPSSLSAGVYVSCVSCVLLGALLSCLQVYSNRLQRVIAAFYNPQREKKRIVFLYNLQLQRQIDSSREQRHSVNQRRTVFPCLSSC